MRKNIPLYREAQGMIKTSRAADANFGLWYDKFCFYWDGNKWTLGENKKDWIATVTGRNICGQVQQIKDAVVRYIDLIRAYGGQVRAYRTVSRFVTGLGREHPVENGFTWHHTLGTPYLPGSSVKGVLRDWVAHWADVSDNNLVASLFGPEGNAMEKSAGDLIFFDALPTSPVTLHTDVMTPHYSEYYRDKGAKYPPADWYNPVPITFLTVSEGQGFIFGIAPRRNSSIDIEQVFDWLDQALKILGAGAKTASGYGCFEPDVSYKIPEVKPLDEQQDEQKNLKFEKMSPIRRQMEDDGYSFSNTEIFMSHIATKWLKKIAEPDIDAADRKKIAQLLADWYKKHKPKDWEKPKPKSKNFDKVKLIKAVLDEG
ncbi:MAG: type III-B CRISPR module RAMP protein Cmr6 [Syntrophaceticus schinkii]|jgi:CRISPR-associated protein Cmr6|nr:type III-B CRISPR module RAMP protein Cmr6 [Syntrophaceticus schinkii]